MVNATFPLVEVIEWTDNPEDGASGGHLLGTVYIDGREYHSPLDGEVVCRAASQELTSVTLTFFASEVRFERREKPE